MSLTKLLPTTHTNDDEDEDVEVGSSAVKLHRYTCDTNTDWPTKTTDMSTSAPLTTDTTGVVVKDVVPRSMYYHDQNNDDDCLCTCACCRCECCPTVSDWCVRDPYGLSCGFTTWFLFVYAQFVIIFVILIPKSHSTLFNFVNLIIFHALEILAVSSHWRTMFSNPGTVPLNNATPENFLKYSNGTVIYRCAMCQSIKPPRAHHSDWSGIMTGTQLYSIYTDTTGIESFKGEGGHRRRHSSFISSLKVVFGSQVGLAWLNPFTKPVNLITQNDERVTFDV
ncbi:hypothetical protein I4U23_024798 [Adineta vaga]|nr:hypothetical protein I4U23_024798 [Adineta vaga]